MDLSALLRLPTALVDWISRNLFGISFQERHDHALETAKALRSLRRQTEAVLEAVGAVEQRLSPRVGEGASGVAEGAVALAGAPADLSTRLSAYSPESRQVSDAPAAVARTFRALDLTVRRARETCLRIIATTLTPQREPNIRA